MTPTKKILLAAAFLAAGYGAASLMGAPRLQILRLPPPLAQATPAPTAEFMPQSEPDAPYGNTAVHLVPDVPPQAMSVFNRDAAAAGASTGNNSQSNFELASVDAPPLVTGEPAEPDNRSPFGPRATLRNEAPRPLAIEPRTPLTVKDIQPIAAVGITPAQDAPPLGAAANPVSTDVVPAQFSNERAAFNEMTSSIDVIAGSPAPIISTAPAPTAYYPQPRTEQPRSHIVVDGDSLAKLAGRYLDDPQRANEIYELNRHLLSNPEVLPIGAELAIPLRSTTLQSNGGPPQSLLPETTPIHSASRGGLVPVRPVPPGMPLMPRAQLARPQPVAGTLRVP